MKLLMVTSDYIIFKGQDKKSKTFFLYMYSIS